MITNTTKRPVKENVLSNDIVRTYPVTIPVSGEATQGLTDKHVGKMIDMRVRGKVHSVTNHHRDGKSAVVEIHNAAPMHPTTDEDAEFSERLNAMSHRRL